MKFFDQFWKKEFYQEGSPKTFLKAYGRLSIVYFVIGGVSAVIFYFSFFATIPSIAEKYGREVKNGYPDALVMTVENGKMTKNMPGLLQLYPLDENLIELQKNNTANVGKEEEPQYLLALDETKEVSLAALKESKAYALFGKDAFIARGSKDIRITPYWQGEPETLTKEIVVTLVEKVVQFSYKVPAILVASVIVGYTIFAPLMLLISAVFIALLVFLISKSKKVFGKTFLYKEAYILTLYALAPVGVVTFCLSFVPFISKMPFMTTILVLCFLGYMFSGSAHKTGHLQKTI